MDEERAQAWSKAAYVRGKPADVYRRDPKGRVICWGDYNNGGRRAWTVENGQAVAI